MAETPSLTTVRVLREGWEFRQVDPPALPHTDLGAWWPADVPGDVHMDLLRLGVIPDPFRRMHERAAQWIDDVGWVYRTAFTVDADSVAGARHLLRFDGIDTVATILLDGEVIAEVDNMFVPHEVDVTDRLAAGSHSLEVQFAPAEVVGAARRLSWLDADGIVEDRSPFSRGVFSRSMVRKAQYMWGWDWGPRLIGCGIWRDVALVRVPVGRVIDWSHRVRFADTPDSRATVTIGATVDGGVSAVAAQLSLDGRVAGAGTATVSRGEASVAIELAAADVARWWPNGMGDQTLYDLRLTALTDGGDEVDRVDARIGLRTVELVREADSDGTGESFGFRINGVDAFAKGANWIPDDSFPARTTPARLDRLLGLARDAHMNMLRIWGGGLYETEEFYERCDELGLLVWQDFPYACALYPDGEDDQRLAAAEATTAVRRIRNHASIALWCGNNENQWLTGLGAYGQVPRVLGNHLYDETLAAVVAAEDPDTPYWPSSPWGAGDGTNHSSYQQGDCHDWNVWHGAGDWRHYASCDARFISEFGFSAPPALATLREALDPADLGVDTPAMRWHDKTGKGYDTYLGFIGLHYAAPADVEQLVHYGQLNQADAMSFGIEHFRRLRPHTMGTLVWQLNDCWPVHSWAWIDYALRPKAAWYAARRFYAPLLVSPHRDRDRLVVHLVNDRQHDIAGDLVTRIVDVDGVELWRDERPACATAAASVVVLDIDLPEAAVANAHRCLVHVAFGGAENTLLLCEPKDFAFRSEAISTVVNPRHGSGTVSIEIASPTIAIGVHLDLDGMDVDWDDNYLTLLPAEPRTVTATGWPGEAPLEPVDVERRLRLRSLAQPFSSQA